MSAQNRQMLRETIYNLRYDMDCIGHADEFWSELNALTDSELEEVLNDILSNE